MSEELARTLAGIRDILAIVVLLAVIGFGAIFLLSIHDAETRTTVPHSTPSPTCIVPDSADPSKCIVTG